ncbi:uncharacterized protein LOC113147401 [Cyclospora cayetanensis]|uniref:Uncharacterized protein LOC113147401 n=1 Tax=Cyclospora cayetanensis TaxID=88456 RepID=A0A6P6S1J4_9EIME|nr:uncharacterized protein LOC113147401 [Cyclospora cayetanensis]
MGPTAGRVVCVLLILTIVPASAFMCSPEICQRCCKPVQTGCEPAFLQTQQGFLVSDHTYCLECSCDNPKSGCGWLAYGAGRIQCTSCQFLRVVTKRLPGAQVSGCEGFALDGEVVYISRSRLAAGSPQLNSGPMFWRLEFQAIGESFMGGTQSKFLLAMPF